MTEGDYRLIITEHVHMLGVRYHSVNVHAPLYRAEIRGALNTWGAENLSYDLRNRARVPNNVDNDARRHGERLAWDEFGNEKGAAGLTAPGAPAIGANANGALFILSLSEVNNHFGSVYQGGFWSIDDLIATCLAGRARGWWLRSLGANDEWNSVAIVNYLGHLLANDAMTEINYLGSRPALWISV